MNDNTYASQKLIHSILSTIESTCKTTKEYQRLGELSDVHYTTLYNWVSGRTVNPTSRKLLSVANALGMSITAKNPGIKKTRLKLVA